ncbi:ABC transporter permease [Bacillus salacetis]|uniref:ABC transporter permease n=1 Tax=Bacillus salacetis TaxID=2315464 RepID=A0A3A1QTA1_9BACI|nr:ABC transporter permease [Bacillus salacetis]RIW30928.1 ABC transporter permease [Bacillus salacetis]
MNNFFLILVHSYLNKIKAKSFIITTLIVAAGIFLLVNLQDIIESFSGDEQDTVAVVDESGELYDQFELQLSSLNEELELEKSNENEKSLEESVEEGDYSGYLILSKDENGLPQGVYKAESIAESAIANDLQAALQGMKSAMAAENLELSPDELASLSSPVSFEREALVEGAKSEEELNQARGIVYILLFFIYFSVIVYANMIAMDVATEKSSRVMEILISSVSPVKQMFAKIIGIGLVGLTQLSVLIAIGYFALSSKGDSEMGGILEFFGFSDIPAGIIVYAVVFFLLGYFLFATLAALLGSLVSRIEDVQQMIMPMTFLIMIGFFIAVFGLGNPEAGFVTAASYIPFFTPMVMFLRVGMLNIAAWEPILGIVILLLSILFLGWFGARVYRGGVLMYGKSNSYKDIKKAIELTKKK